MNITDYAYITSVKDVAFRPALEMLEAAMLPAKMPRMMGALGYVRRREKECWRNPGRKTCKYGKLRFQGFA